MIEIDLNADMGEEMGDDAALLTIVSSANIACGGHAGTKATMRATVREAIRNGVAIGAHPGFEDRENFGRRRLDLPHAEISALVGRQVEALKKIAEEEGGRVSYVKLHGALANMTAENEDMARAAFAPLAAIDPALKVLALDNSAQSRAAEAVDLHTIREAYADRAYTAEGLLVSRQMDGAVLTETEKVVAQCLRLAERGEIVSLDGTVLKSEATSICVHGDTPGAVAMARRIAQVFADNNIAIAAPG